MKSSPLNQPTPMWLTFPQPTILAQHTSSRRLITSPATTNQNTSTTRSHFIAYFSYIRTYPINGYRFENMTVADVGSQYIQRFVRNPKLYTARQCFAPQAKKGKTVKYYLPSSQPQRLAISQPTILSQHTSSGRLINSLDPPP